MGASELRMRASLMGRAQSARSSISRAGVRSDRGSVGGLLSTEQAFRRLTVRAGLIHGADNVPFLQRRDAWLLGVGRSSAAHSRSEGPSIPIRVKLEQEAALA